jgi:general secretion pathway protein G
MNIRRNKAFTLIELLIVIAVIAIIIGIALPRFKGMKDEGNIIRAKADLRTLQTAVESYYIHNNDSYPSSLSDLTSAVPSIVGTLPSDPYDPGNDYGYDRGGTDNQYYVIFSEGPDGNGSAVITDVTNVVTETNGSSCIFVSNVDEDLTP